MATNFDPSFCHLPCLGDSLRAQNQRFCETPEQVWSHLFRCGLKEKQQKGNSEEIQNDCGRVIEV